MEVGKVRFHVVFVIATCGIFSFCEGYYLELLRYHIDHSTNEQEAKTFLSNYDREVQKLQTEMTLAEWNFNTNLTKENEKVLNSASKKLSEFDALAFVNASKYDTATFTDDTKRQLKKVGKEPLPDKEEEELNKIMSEMQNIYSTTTVCFNGTEWAGTANIASGYSTLGKGQKEQEQFNVPIRLRRDLDFEETFPSWNKKVPMSLKVFNSLGQTKFPLKTLPGGVTSYSIPFSVNSYSALPANHAEECLPLSPDLEEIMETSNDHKLRTYVWQEWRKQAGRKMKPMYERYVELINKKSRINGYDNAGDEWRSRYETDNFEENVLEIYKKLEPLYKQLHAYIRRKLYQKYGKEVIDIKGKLPASLLSDMWGRFWNNLYRDVVPYPNRPNLDVSSTMKDQGYDVKRMFESADDFFAGMGLKRVENSFWNNSMLEKPQDGRKVVCHASAWDFYDGKDFRIKMCTKEYSSNHLGIVYHEMGHIQYFMQYSHLPNVYRDGANDGFHEAIGELINLAASAPKYLHSINLLSDDEYKEEDPETDINFLMSQALNTISTLPFHLVNDLWRWKVFRNEVPKNEWNTLFWKLKNEYVGAEAPTERSSADLDPPTLWHINGGVDMIRYFTRTIFQFQFFEALCNIADPDVPLHKCNISGSKEAGTSLANMLKLGSSLPWPDALEKLTGNRKMSVDSLLSFFEPLRKWLEKTNKINGDEPGWNTAN